MKSHVNQCRFYLSQSQRILDGLGDSHRAIEPMPGAKTSGWILGHLSVTGDYARRLCGRKPICPREWRGLYSPGTTPSTDAGTYAPMGDLITTFRSVYEDLCIAAVEADPATMAAANPYEPARAAYATTGEFVEYMLTGHLAYHLGQLVAWRSAAGLGRTKPDGLAPKTA